MQARRLRKQIEGPDWILIGTLGVLLFGYLLFHDLTGGTLLSHNAYDSYSLQALSWLHGSMSIDPAYTWLELASYDGQLFVSFPPVPSVFLLPWVLAFGENTPSNLVAMLVALATVTFCYEAFRENGAHRRDAIFWAVFYVYGSNMLWMSTSGGVWFLAQGCNLMFCTAAVWALLCRRDGLALTLLALAVGCRPFSICLFGMVFAILLRRAARFTGRRGVAVAKTFRLLIVPALIAAAYMWYNSARFGDPFEFGHDYLPEFAEADEGQFSLSYVPVHLEALFATFPVPDERLGLTFPAFDGFAFFLANPMFLLFFVYWIRDMVRRQMTARRVAWVVAFWVNLFLLTLHKTMGGWQFGARYTVDLLPYALLYLLEDGAAKPNTFDCIVCACAILFNLYGALVMNFKEGFAF